MAQTLIVKGLGQWWFIFYGSSCYFNGEIRMTFDTFIPVF